MLKWQANLDHKFFQLPDRTLHTYNAHDSHNTAKLLLALQAELRSPRFPPSHERWFHEVIQPLQGAVMAMQHRGFAVDLEARRKFTEDTARELAETDNAICREAAKRSFPYTDKFPNSDKQVASLLHDSRYCDLRSHKSTDSGRPSVDQDALLRILRQLRKKDEPCRQLLLDLCHRSRLQTVLERYTTFGVGPDGRVRATVKMAAVKSYRFAYAEPALQQFPPEVRGYFVAGPGNILVSADYCVDPETGVLTSQLKWKKAIELKVGDELIGFPENLTGNGKSGHVYKPSVVTNNVLIRSRRVKVKIDDGREIICSSNHWFVRNQRKSESPRHRYSQDDKLANVSFNYGGRCWTKASQLRPGDCLSSMMTPKTRNLWEGVRTWSRSQVPAKVVSVEELGDGLVCSISTSTRTLITEGLLSHNCQLEPQWLALLADDEPMLKVFRSGGDIHKSNVLELFNVSEAEWETWPSDRRKSYRNYAKSNFLYKIVYGGEGSDTGRTYCPCPRCVDKVPQVAEFKRPERLAAEQRWFAGHPDVRRFQRDLVSEVRHRGYYDSPFGVRRYLARTWGPDAEREIKNIPEQMNAALLMNRCQVELHRRSAPIILQHHDSFVLEVPDSPGSVVDQWEADLRGVMESPVPEVDNYSFPVEISKGYRWSDL